MRGLLLLAFVTFAFVASAHAPTLMEDAAPRFTLALSEVGLEAGGANTVSSGAEPVIHVTRDGSTILVGDVSGLYRSTDGGATWSRAPDPFLPGVFADGWAIAEDDEGRIYVTTTQGQIVGVASSSDRGASWDIQSDIVAVASIADRPWIAARGDGEVALIIFGETGEECYRSTDRGATWLDRSLVNTGDPNAGSAALDSRGRLWFSNGNAFYRWPAPCRSAPYVIDHPDAGPQILTQADVDASDRPYTAIPTANSAQMRVHSWAPGGVTKTLAVSPSHLRSNTFGAIDVDRATGDLAIGWYGSTTPGDPSSSSFQGDWHVYVARVSGFWGPSPTIELTQVTSVPNHVGGFCMGGIGCTTGTADRDLLDYFGVTFAPDGSIHVAYGHDGAGSNAVVRYAYVG